jgi:NADPH:quinone reductase-like Zn-dependent oxidoreductase
MKALQIGELGSVENVRLADLPDPEADRRIAVVQVAAASINPSDVKNAEGKMEGTTLPRVLGRDYAGVVIAGPDEWSGAEVWGTGGEIGYTVDGSHAEKIAVPVASLRRKPKTLSLEQAATVGVSYLAAWIGIIEYARLEQGETLLVIGAGGGVGGAAAQIGRWRGARVVGVDRRPLPSEAPAARALDAFAALGPEPLEKVLRAAAGPGGANVVFNAVGADTFEPALRALAPRGRHVVISSMGERPVTFDLRDFYHNESQLLGVDTRKRDAVASAAVLDALTPGFESGAFAAPAIDRAIPLASGREAYAQIARGEARGRLVLVP